MYVKHFGSEVTDESLRELFEVCPSMHPWEAVLDSWCTDGGTY